MTAYKIDNKRRITLKEAKPGEIYDVQYIGGGHYKLARMTTEPEPTGREQFKCGGCNLELEGEEDCPECGGKPRRIG